MVEAAFVMPVFILMIFGIFEFSGAIMAKTGANASVKGGARMAIVAGNDALADQRILLRMAKDGSGLSQDTIDKVVIWKITFDSNGKAITTPPNGCLTAGGFRVVVGGCNVYNNPQDPTYGAFTKAKLPLSVSPNPPTASNADYYFGCDTTTPTGVAASGNKLDCGWQPQSRRILEKSPTYTCINSKDPKCAATDWIGIYIEYTHKYYTGFFGKQVTLHTSTIAAIEPQGYDK